MNKQKIKIKEQGKMIKRLEQARQTSNAEAINTGTPGSGGGVHDNEKMDEIVTRDAGRCTPVNVVDHM
jgi:hypothetical protein